MATYEQVTYNSPDGAQIGKDSSTPLGFYGATPAARTAFTASAVETTLAVSTTSNIWGYSTSTQANAIVTLANEIRSALVTLGLKS